MARWSDELVPLMHDRGFAGKREEDCETAANADHQKTTTFSEELVVDSIEYWQLHRYGQHTILEWQLNDDVNQKSLTVYLRFMKYMCGDGVRRITAFGLMTPTLI